MRPRATVALAIALIVATSFLIYKVLRGELFGVNEVNEPSYEIESKDGDIEIRSYKGFVIAQTTVSAPFREATDNSFRSLYAYITGANRGRANIDMTAPVLVEPASEKIPMTVPVLVEPSRNEMGEETQRLDGDRIGAWTVAFILPADYTPDRAPLPTNGLVEIRNVEPHRVASIRFNGQLDEERGETYRIKQASLLAERDLENYGDWKLAGYDPPFTLPMFRRNEVLVTLR